jgi:hypothetical protein
MNKIQFLFFSAIFSICTEVSADEMVTVLIQGTHTICSNDKKPVAMNSNLQVAIPESAIQGKSWYSTSEYSLARDVNVKIGSRNCTLPKWDGSKGTVLERIVIQISCTEGSSIKFQDQSTGEFYDLDLYADGAKTLCGGESHMFKRVSARVLELEKDKYLVKDEKEIYMSDTKAQFNTANDPQFGRVNLFTSSEMKYKIPYVTGVYVPSAN